MLKGKSFTHLSKEERVKIEVLLHQGFTLSKVATAIGRSVSTVSREVKRNGRQRYFSGIAQAKTTRRHRLKAKHRVFDEWMKAFIAGQLVKKRLSPELIAVEGKSIRGDFISAEWIYQWIWKMKFSQAKADKSYQSLFKYLRHASRKRKRGNKRGKRGNILERVWIDQRAGVASTRERKGDLECDIMLGRDRQPGLLVALDRRSRKVWIRKLRSKNARYVMGLLKTICRRANVRTITFDNDQSFAEHYRLHALGVETFFTHPYSSQEKGSVENRIGLMRMFMSKKTDFTKVTSGEVKRLQTMINKRPLRMFNYCSPDQIHQS
jgi:transposase, IS30 family